MIKNMPHFFAKFTVQLVAVSLFFCVVSCQSIHTAKLAQITESEVLAAQELWAKGMVEIANAYQKKEDYHKAAQRHVTRCYGYDMGQVLFRPTTVWEHIYRPTAEGAVSYFVGGNSSFPNDRKAVNPLLSVRFENAGIQLYGNLAIAMGRYYFTRNTTTEPSLSEYTFAYKKNPKGELKIIMHSSHQPYKP
jgi:hypothetical protein